MTVDPDLADWLRLTFIQGVGDRSIHKLLGAFGLPSAIFAASRGDIGKLMSDAQASKLFTARDDAKLAERIDATLAWAAQPENVILTLADADYPRGLLECGDAPPLIYLKGDYTLLNAPCVAIVGSRNATAAGLANADSFAAALSAAGYTVVSGLAAGIDSAAHEGGLKGKGRTIAIVGTGLDIVYPARNRALAHRIAQEGLLVSEFALGTPAMADNFPRRNRIISGLSKGVLVVEAALRSGSLITARLAGEQGRDVFALPGSIHAPLSKGCHKLIKDGAKLVDAVEDILQELGMPRDLGDAPRPLPDAALAASPLLIALGYDPISLDSLCARANVSAEAATAELMQLELEGLVQSLPGNRFARVK